MTVDTMQKEYGQVYFQIICNPSPSPEANFLSISNILSISSCPSYLLTFDLDDSPPLII